MRSMRMLAHMGRALELVPDRPLDAIQPGLEELQLARSALVRTGHG